jgi:hypothetical protein
VWTVQFKQKLVYTMPGHIITHHGRLDAEEPEGVQYIDEYADMFVVLQSMG